jgi:hypothetical protein
VPPAAGHHRALHGSRAPCVLPCGERQTTAQRLDATRGHYRRELALLRARSAAREEEEAAAVRPGLMQDIRDTNEHQARLGRIGRAAG